MNEHQAVCPQCKQEVSFRKQGRVASCPICGFHYELSEPPYLGSFQPAERQDHPLAQFLKMMAVVLFVLMGVGAVLVGILFVGCALAFRG